jgi:hypothetical protein
MSMREAIALALLLAACAISRAEGPRLGRLAAPDEIARFDIGIGPSGMARAGRLVYESRCGACRGEKGESSYRRYATTVCDYVRRAMSFDAPRSLRYEEVYAVTAHLLHLEGVIAEDATIDAASLPRIEMANGRGFTPFAPGN